jgi:hypothetical protein
MLTAEEVRKEYLFPFELIQQTICRHCVVNSQNKYIHSLPPLSVGLSWEDWVFKELLKGLLVMARGLDLPWADVFVVESLAYGLWSVELWQSRPLPSMRQ